METEVVTEAEECPLAVACKLARYLGDLDREAKRRAREEELKPTIALAIQKLNEFYKRRSGEDSRREKLNGNKNAKNENSLMSRVEACFNGHPVNMRDVLPGEGRMGVSDAIHNLAREGRLVKVSSGVYKRP